MAALGAEKGGRFLIQNTVDNTYGVTDQVIVHFKYFPWSYDISPKAMLD